MRQSVSIKHAFVATIVPLLLLMAATGSTSATGDPTSWSASEWSSWRDQEIATILEPTCLANDVKILRRADVIQRSLEAYNVIKPCLDRDPDFFSDDPQREQSLGNFVRFVTALHWMGLTETVDGDVKNSSALGLEVADARYWELAAPYLQFPDLLKSQSFLTAMSNPATYHEAVAMIDEHNQSLPPDRKWIPLLFRAHFIPTVDGSNTFGRLLVVIPNEPFSADETIDRWIAFGIATPEMSPETEMRSVSMVTVCKGAADRDTNRVYFSDFMRTRDAEMGEFTINSNFIARNDPSHNCYYCHKSAVIPIHPEAEYVFDAANQLVEKPSGAGGPSSAHGDILVTSNAEVVNAIMKQYRAPDYGVQDTGAYGPCLGPDGAERTDDFIRAATQGLNLPISSYGRVRDAMICSRCHSSFAPINYPQSVRTDLDFVAFKDGKGMVQTYVDQGLMPPGADLTPIERRALWRCLMTEYFDPTSNSGLLEDWLRGEPGSASST